MNDYEQVRTLGEGGYGKAILVKRKKDNQLFVIKSVKLRGLPENEKKEALYEVQVLSYLRHPNIITYIDSFQEKEVLHIVMEYADGGDLGTKVQKQGKTLFTEDYILSIFTQIALAIKYMHDRKILHRDLKLQNIFLMKSGIAKLGDFGIAKALDRTNQFLKTQIGTPYYLSPEICEGKNYNTKTDIWSLGCILYEMCTLHHAFEGRNINNLLVNIIRGHFAPINPQYSQDLRNLVASMLTKNPDQRPSANQILSLPFIRARIASFLSEAEAQREMDHTVFHGVGAFPNVNPPIPDPINNTPEIQNSPPPQPAGLPNLNKLTTARRNVLNSNVDKSPGPPKPLMSDSARMRFHQEEGKRMIERERRMRAKYEMYNNQKANPRQGDYYYLNDAEDKRKQELIQRNQMMRQNELKRQQELQRQQEILKQQELLRQQEYAKQQEILRQQELQKQQDLLRQQDMLRQQEYARQQELNRQKEIQRQQELIKQQELMRQQELQRQQELDRMRVLEQQEREKQRILEQQEKMRKADEERRMMIEKQMIERQNELRRRQEEQERLEEERRRKEQERRIQMERQRLEMQREREEKERRRMEIERNRQIEYERQMALKREEEKRRQEEHRRYQLELEAQKAQARAEYEERERLKREQLERARKQAEEKWLEAAEQAKKEKRMRNEQKRRMGQNQVLSPIQSPRQARNPFQQNVREPSSPRSSRNNPPRGYQNYVPPPAESYQSRWQQIDQQAAQLQRELSDRRYPDVNNNRNYQAPQVRPSIYQMYTNADIVDSLKVGLNIDPNQQQNVVEERVPMYYENQELNLPVANDVQSMKNRANAIRDRLVRHIGQDKMIALKNQMLGMGGQYPPIKVDPMTNNLMMQLLYLDGSIESGVY